MPLERLTSLVRVLVFYFVALLLLLLLGGLLQGTLGLPGVMLMQLLIFLGLPVVFTTAAERKPLKPFLRLRMLSPKGFAKAICLGVVGWLMAQSMGSLIILLLRQMGGEMIQPYEILLDAPAWLALFAGALIPAICEELSFRGYVLGALRPLGPAAAVILTGLLFGALHLSLIRLIPLSLLGMLWALTVQRSGSILPGMIMHFLNNGIALGLTFFVQGRVNPAEMQGLDGIPMGAQWGAIAVLTVMSVGLGTAAYFLAASFGLSDLARPATAEREESGPVYASPEEVPAEVRHLEAELAALKGRRRRMLQATALVVGGLTLTIYFWAAWQELAAAFG